MKRRTWCRARISIDTKDGTLRIGQNLSSLDSIGYICSMKFWFLVEAFTSVRSRKQPVPSNSGEILHWWILKCSEEIALAYSCKTSVAQGCNRELRDIVKAITAFPNLVNNFFECKNWGFHGGDYAEWCLLGCYSVWLMKEPTFRRNLASPPSGWQDSVTKNNTRCN
jgi:hypothetical protein